MSLFCVIHRAIIFFWYYTCSMARRNWCLCCVVL